jgi:hypothetical protein
MTPTIVSFFTRGNDGDYYVRHAERLRRECAALGVPVWIKEVEWEGRPWIEMLRMKPMVILEALEVTRGPVFWIDVDGSVLRRMDLIELRLAVPQVIDFMAVQKPPEHPRPFYMGGSFWGRTPGARAFLRAWLEEYEHEGSEELAFQRAFERCKFLRWLPLPIDYMRIEGVDRIEDSTVVVHRISKGPSKAAFLAERRKKKVSLTVATVLKSGGCFTPEWVHRINRQIREHMDPDRLVCLTDMELGDAAHSTRPKSGLLRASGPADHSGCVRIPLVHDWPGWWSKLELFRPGLFDGTVVYFDLDTLICGRLPEFRPAEPRRLTMLNDFYNRDMPASGMMLWDAARYGHIYERFAENPSFPEHPALGDGHVIGKYCVERVQALWPGLVGSYKVDKLRGNRNAGPRGFKVVCFHGTPKQHEVERDSWVWGAWIGEGNGHKEARERTKTGAETESLTTECTESTERRPD